jgi:hypothetical protein
MILFFSHEFLFQIFRISIASIEKILKNGAVAVEFQKQNCQLEPPSLVQQQQSNNKL